jgi:hypothetical protein
VHLNDLRLKHPLLLLEDAKTPSSFYRMVIAAEAETARPTVLLFDQHQRIPVVDPESLRKVQGHRKEDQALQPGVCPPPPNETPSDLADEVRAHEPLRDRIAS